MGLVGQLGANCLPTVLDTKRLSAAAPILEEYGLSCESNMSLVDEEDLVALCSKLKQFQSKLLRKWVQGLGAEQRAAAFMKDASAAKKNSISPPLEDKGEEDEDEEENGDEDADADEAEDSDEEDKEAHGGAAGEQGADTSSLFFCVASVADKRPQLLPSGTSLQHVQCHFWRGSETCLRGLP